jgi:transcriptional regulator with XRE-family HTH domain
MNGCALRKARKWTLRELSRRTGIAVSYLSALEWNEGGNRNPTASVLVSLADALEVSIDELCGRLPPTANGWVWMSEHQWNEIKDSAYGLRALMEDAEKVPSPAYVS